MNLFPLRPKARCRWNSSKDETNNRTCTTTLMAILPIYQDAFDILPFLRWNPTSCVAHHGRVVSLMFDILELIFNFES